MFTKFSKLAVVVATASIALTGCSQGASDSAQEKSSEKTSNATSAAAENTTLSITDNHGTVEIKTPVSRPVSTDNRTFEVLDQWGVKLVAAPKMLVPSTIPDYKNDDEILDIGSHKEPNLEVIVAAEPDLIINGQRFGRSYEQIKEMNPDTPIVELEPREGEPFADELKRQVTELGKIFDKEDEAQKLIEDFDKAVERAKKAYNGNDTVMAVNVSGGQIGYVAPSTGRVWGPVFDLLGLKPALEVPNASDNHKGDDISPETIAESNPDWIFVLDRDGAISKGKDGYTPALDVIKNNPALGNVAAIKDEKTVLAPEDTYTNESIITYTEILNSIADSFEAKK
ncbi:iron ABC transporter substrate-binding protein [Corynebacterium sp. sy017]|uniref:siderophore ABC transporter substrate-binding protein n=1 Tax=unclassified Corynebacterium TaxID=2624378 RepID=UPI001185868B|nr:MULTISPECIES: ABC transporter substrate-binding protein [unclassified Corynebacterium]MBP3089197.1 iron ABC transporter substrate-binding protein [Corynebacterium sp. sy017]TSD91095.1 iron ABC transporter substrate-binding protein [Corynebacterium sp. SY003]